MHSGRVYREHPCTHTPIMHAYAYTPVHRTSITQVIGYTYVIEFQKRGLPHAHILIIVADAPRTPEEYDKYVCAELCDASTPRKKRLQNLQLKHMVHKCQDSCYAEEDKAHEACLKGYPKDFRRETMEGEDSYTKYRRRSPSDGGVVVETRRRKIDNRRIVPHNLWLLEK